MPFITLEGTDGCGKTTQLRLLAARLKSTGHEIVETVEPGGTAIGRQIRKILLDPANANLDTRAELLLYFASRAQNVEQVIRPALARRAIVVCDRFTDSTLAYQGHGRGLDCETILTLDRIACAGLTPDLTLLIDIDLATGLARARIRNQRTANDETRLDDESAAFHTRVRDGYLALAARHSNRIRVVNGALPIEEVAENIWQLVQPYV